MPEEIRFFVRVGTFGVAITVVYWLVSYDWAGTLLLLGFGLAGAFLASMFAAGLRSRGGRLGAPWRWIGLDEVDRPPLALEPRRYPSPGLAPLAGGLGISIAAVGLVYGAGFLLMALPLLVVAAVGWVSGAVAEHAAELREEESDATAVHGGTVGAREDPERPSSRGAGP